MNNLKLGLCSVTFRKKSVEEVVEAVKKSGLHYIEWGGDIHVTTSDDAEKVKNLCDKAQIKISSYGSYFNCIDYDKNVWVKTCQIAQEMGAESIRVWLGKKDSELTSEDEYKLLLSNTAEMCDVASEYNLSVCPECHDNTFNNNTDAFLRLTGDLKKDNFKTYFQSRYFRMEYDLDRIDRTFDYIKDVHVSYRDLIKEQRYRKKDKNYLDKLLKKLLSKDFDGIVMIEFVSKDNEAAFLKDVEKLKNINPF